MRGVAEVAEDLMNEWGKFKTERIGQIDRLQKQVDEIQKRAQRIGGYAPSEGDDGAKAAHREAFAAFLRKGDVGQIHALQTKARLQIAVEADGGFTVPEDMAKEIAVIALNYSPIRKLADVRATSRADFAMLINTGSAGAEWRGESEVRNETATPKFSQVKPAHGELSAIAPITQWLLSDSEFDMERFIVEAIGRSFAVSEGAAFISGNGVNRPRGILASTFALTADDTRAFGELEKVKSGTSGSFSADNLLALLYRLRPQYRANAAWLMNPTTLESIRRMKTSSGDYIWEPSGKAGQPSTLFGAPVYEDPNVPVPAANSLSVLCGDFKAGYTITDIGQPLLVRDEVTTKGTVKFYVAKRVGGIVTDSLSIKALSLEV